MLLGGLAVCASIEGGKVSLSTKQSFVWQLVVFKGIDKFGEECKFSLSDSTERLILFAEVMPQRLTVFAMHRSPGRGERCGWQGARGL